MPEPALWATNAVPQIKAQSISMRECFVCVFILADALHFHQTVEVVTAGIVGNGNAVACVGVKVADVAVVVLAVGGEIEGGVVHILRAAVHLSRGRP